MRYCVIGSPVKHSGSPALFSVIFRQRGLDHIYVINEITTKEQLAAFFEEMRAGLWAGCNVTMPWKTESVQFLDELTPEGALTGAVNTIALRGNRLSGHSTDGIGMMTAIEKASGQSDVIKGSSILVLGCGGAARSVIASAVLHGAGKLMVSAREGANLSLTYKLFNDLSDRGCSTVTQRIDHNDPQAVIDAVREADIVINCTPVGMDPGETSGPLPSGAELRRGMIVADAVYKTEETFLLKSAAAAGCLTIAGRSMLYEQAQAGASFFFEHT